MKKILVIDNYDSFTYNLVHYINEITGEEAEVYRNDKIELEEIKNFDKILLSPGPGIPVEAGLCIDLIKEYAKSKSIMGVCLGHQAIGEAFGAKLTNLSHVYHGVASEINILTDSDTLFKSLPKKLEVGRYHSWVVEKQELPDCFDITCESDDGLIMGISHKTYDVKGVQFHPESVLTRHGMDMMRNWIQS